MTTQNDYLGKGKRATSDNQLKYEDETTSEKGKQATSNNRLGYEDEENNVKQRTSPKALHKDLDRLGDQSEWNS